MLDIRKRIFIIIVAGVGLILAVVVFLLIGRRAPSAPSAGGVFQADQAPLAGGGAAQSAQGGVMQDKVLPASAAPLDERRYARQVAAMFVERFSSFSNQNDNAHLADAKALSTDSMRKWLDTQRLAQEQVYAGVTTRIVASSVASFANGRATVLVDVQQEKSTPTTTGVSYRHGRVELVKENNDWKVNGLYWE